MVQLIHKEFILHNPNHKMPILTDMRFPSSDDRLPIIIFCHGFKGFKDWGHFNYIADYFAGKGFAFIKFNFSHNGTTPSHPTEFVDLEAFGNNNITTELDDLQVVINAIKNTDPIIHTTMLNSDKLFLIGHSRGGGVAILKAAEEKSIKKVCTWAPVHDFKERYSGEVIKQWKRDNVYVVHNSRTGQDMPLYYQMVENIYNNEFRTDIPKALQRIKQPILAIHGTNDETLDYRNTQQMIKHKSDLKVDLIDDAGHTFGGSHPWGEENLPFHTEQLVDITHHFFIKD